MMLKAKILDGKEYGKVGNVIDCLKDNDNYFYIVKVKVNGKVKQKLYHENDIELLGGVIHG